MNSKQTENRTPTYFVLKNAKQGIGLNIYKYLYIFFVCR